MNWNNHSNLSGSHAFLSASKYHWVNYDELKLEQVYLNWMASQRGTRFHELAAELIELRQKLQRSPNTFNLYVNDGIGFKMKTEVVLYYSPNCFGTADAICFRDNFLRIHDLKTGKSRVSVTQLEVYAALFCLEYNYSPNEIEMELRIYQSDEVIIHIPQPEDILYIMQKIKDFDERIQRLSQEE